MFLEYKAPKRNHYACLSPGVGPSSPHHCGLIVLILHLDQPLPASPCPTHGLSSQTTTSFTPRASVRCPTSCVTRLRSCWTPRPTRCGTSSTRSTWPSPTVCQSPPTPRTDCKHTWLRWLMVPWPMTIRFISHVLVPFPFSSIQLIEMQFGCFLQSIIVLQHQVHGVVTKAS